VDWQRERPKGASSFLLPGKTVSLFFFSRPAEGRGKRGTKADKRPQVNILERGKREKEVTLPPSPLSEDFLHISLHSPGRRRKKKKEGRRGKLGAWLLERREKGKGRGGGLFSTLTSSERLLFLW